MSIKQKIVLILIKKTTTDIHIFKIYYVFLLKVEDFILYPQTGGTVGLFGGEDFVCSVSGIYKLLANIYRFAHQ